MSDSNKDQDPIEDFFERNAWEYDIPFREADWLRLEKKLDIKDRQRAARRRRRWIAAAAVILLGLMGYFTYQNYSQINEINDMLQAQKETDEQALQPREELSTEMPGNESETSQDPDLGLTTAESASNDDSRGMYPSFAEDVTGKALAEASDIRDGSGGLIPQSRIYGLSVTELACNECEQLIPDQQQVAALETNIQRTSVLDGSEISTSSEPKILDRTDISNENGSDIASRLGISLLAGPDLSTAGSISKFYNPGYTVGFMAEYQILDRLSLRAGLQRSQVRYTAGRGEYNPPPGYWTNGVVAEQTTAQCLILDIPLSLKFEILRFSNSALYTTGGFSSYIMLNETYRYDYAYSNGQQGLVQEWSDKTGTKHWLSNAMVSIGYELKLNKNWGIRAEPYLKLPVREVGWGNVNLYSTGSIVSLNYQFGSK